MSAWLGFASPGAAQTVATSREPRAVSCDDRTHGFLAIVVREPNVDAGIAWQDVVRHVQGELRARGVAACTGEQGRPALGWLELEVTTPERVRIALRFADDATPAVERSLELGRLPADARALSIAVAADELLAANWQGVQRRAARATPAPRRAPSAMQGAALPSPRFWLGPSFVLELYGGGQQLLGADARFGWRFAARWALTLRAGIRQGLPEQAPHGSLHSSAFEGGFGIHAALIDDRALTLALLARADALRLAASAYANAGAVAHEQHGLALVTSGGPLLELHLSRRLSFSLEAVAGAALRPVHLTDSGARVSGVSGSVLSLAGGVSATF